MTFIPIAINAARICDGLSKIGYTPASALCDIIDNSVQADATKVWVHITRDTRKADSAKNNVREYTIIDNGKGMSEDAILKSLELGSSDEHYGSGSLSRFGLGLKSASFSQGEILEILSRNDATQKFKKYRVSLPLIREKNAYGIEAEPLDKDDKELISDLLENQTGTIIRIREVRKINHPPLKRTLAELKLKVGVIYFYFMEENSLEIEIDGTKCIAKDPLFTAEANENGDLDETNWDGKTVRWIQRPKGILLDADNSVKAIIEVTNLIHPPTFKIEGGEALRVEVRDKYNIGANNYGFYIYRNKRLIAWADRLEGIISAAQDQDLFAFRGRILINSDADDLVNIDVKKSHIQLSDEAYDIVDNYCADYKRKSRNAWNAAKNRVEDIPHESVEQKANEVAEATQQTIPNELPGEPDDAQTLEEKDRREEHLMDELKAKAQEDVAYTATQLDNDSTTATPQPAAASNEKPKFIELVPTTTDNVLWELYYDATLGIKVRINRNHRFSKLVYGELRENKQLRLVLDNLFYTFVQAEKHTLKKQQNLKYEQVQSVLDSFKEVASQFLINTARALESEIKNLD